MSAPRNSLARQSPEFRSASPEPAEELGLLSLPPEHARVLLFVAARPAALALALIVPAILATLLTSGSDLTGVSGAVAATWLAMHQVPLVIGTTTLGILPLLPTVALLWVATRECLHAVDEEPTRADLGWLFGAAVGGPLLITAVCLAVAEDASGVVPLQPPNPLTAFTWVLVLHLGAASCAVAVRCRQQIFDWLPYDVVAAGYVAGRTVLRLLGAGAVVVVLAALVQWSRLGESYQHAGNIVGVLGLTVLSLLYLPNVAVVAVGVLVGPGAQLGAASVGVFAMVDGPVPAVPVLAAVPTGPPAVWWPVLLLVPAVVGVLGGIEIARVSYDRIGSPWALLGSAALATAALTLTAGLADGTLGGFGHIGLKLPIFVPVTFAWLALAGYAGLVYARLFVVSFGTPILRRSDTRYDPDYEDYFDDELSDDDYLAGFDRARDPDLPEPTDELPGPDAGAPERSDDGSVQDNEYGPLEVYTEDPDPRVELDAELVEDEPVEDLVRRPAPADPAVEIVDAEVVEMDSPEADRSGGR